ncbi:hypothetical protein [Almyronema epifaneia]|uniref:DALR anticodon binding domain-containing protein n=1 Tax=Almyronema epifaneia S1 TaxID=2991925 RepID=A0ABW6IEA9_9CYAN
MPYLSLQWMLKVHLYQALYDSTCSIQVPQSQVTNCPSLSFSLAHNDIQSLPISKTKNSFQVSYQSPIALKLKKTCQQPVQSITQNLINRLATLPPVSIPEISNHQSPLTAFINSIWLDVEIGIAVNGWLRFTFPEKSLSLWCTHFWDTSKSDRLEQRADHLSVGDFQYIPRFDASQLTAEARFRLQYNYARCCLLINRLQQVYKGSFSDLAAIAQQAASSQFTHHQAEQNLLHAVIELADSCFSAPLKFKQPPLAQLLQLSHQTEQFCRRYADFQTEDLALAYLKLLMTIRCLLKHCLVVEFQIEASPHL